MRFPSMIPFLFAACSQPEGQAGGRNTPPAPASAPASARTDPAAEAVVARWQGGAITYGELATSLENDLKRIEVDYLTQRHDAQRQGLEQMVLDRLVELEAKKRGMDAGALLEAEVRGKVADPTDAEIEAFYPQVQRQFRNAPLEAVRSQVASALRQRGERDRFLAYVEELKRAYGVELDLPPPELPRFVVSVDDDPSRGSPDAKVTIVQFAEFQCPYCGLAYETVNKVLADYDGKVRMVFRDFPLSFHDRAVPAAVAANCAGEQDRYWQMFEQLMTHQRALSDADLEGYATASGVDLAKWKACREDPKHAAEVQADMEAGTALGITGTPAFFINGISLSGARPYEDFKAIIDRELGGG